jgi:Sortase domain
VVIPALEIDLPIVAPDVRVPGQGPTGYPPCDVAVYHEAFVQPGEDGTTYLYAHARTGMFLPLLTESQQHNGSAMLGSVVEVYTDDDLRYVYTISQVKRHATDFSIAGDGETQQLVLQTSEGPRGTIPKLQVLASLQDILPATDAAAHPKAHPRGCYNTP